MDTIALNKKKLNIFFANWARSKSSHNKKQKMVSMHVNHSCT